MISFLPFTSKVFDLSSSLLCTRISILGPLFTIGNRKYLKSSFQIGWVPYIIIVNGPPTVPDTAHKFSVEISTIPISKLPWQTFFKSFSDWELVGKFIPRSGEKMTKYILDVKLFKNWCPLKFWVDLRGMDRQEYFF